MTGTLVIRLIFLNALATATGHWSSSLQAIHNWGHDRTESLYESPVEYRQPMKTSHFSNILELRSFYIAWIF